MDEILHIEPEPIPKEVYFNGVEVGPYILEDDGFTITVLVGPDKYLNYVIKERRVDGLVGVGIVDQNGDVKGIKGFQSTGGQNLEITFGLDEDNDIVIPDDQSIAASNHFRVNIDFATSSFRVVDTSKDGTRLRRGVVGTKPDPKIKKNILPHSSPPIPTVAAQKQEPTEPLINKAAELFDRFQRSEHATRGESIEIGPRPYTDGMLVGISDGNISASRPHNEDYVTAGELKGAGENALVIVVNDGVRGEKGGKVAARFAAYLINQYVQNPSREVLEMGIPREALTYADKVMANTPSGEVGRCASACIYLKGSALHLATVGDTRVRVVRYEEVIDVVIPENPAGALVRQGEAESLQDAHTKLEELARQQGRTYRKSIILSALGTGRADAAVGHNRPTFGLRPGDIVLVSTDGLDTVSDTNIISAAKEFSTHKSADAVRQLIEIAKERGSTDNITAVMFTYEPKQ